MSNETKEFIEKLTAHLFVESGVPRNILFASTPAGLTFPSTLSCHHAAIENRRCRLKMLGVDDDGLERVKAAADRNSRLGGLYSDTFVEVERRILRGEKPSAAVDDVAQGTD